MSRDLTGMRFGRWTVLEKVLKENIPNACHDSAWVCLCECGTKKIVRGVTLLNGQSQSCGCLQKEQLSKRASKHHGFGTRLYTIWNSMRQRCNNPRCHAYKNYGGRGIGICHEWDDYVAFKDWAILNGYDESAPRGEYTLDRKDVNGDYCPDNCRWANVREQSNNKRNTLVVEHGGEIHSLSEWADILGIKYCTLWKRYKRGASIFD